MVNIEKSSYMQNDDDIGRRLPTLVARERLKSAVVLSVNCCWLLISGRAITRGVSLLCTMLVEASTKERVNGRC